MGSPDEVIYGKLKNTAGVTAVCSTKIYPGAIPQGVRLPAIAYSEISAPRIHAMGRDINLSAPLYEVAIFSTGYSQAKNLAKQVRYALQDYKGSTWANVQRIFMEDETYLADVDPDTKRIVHHYAQEYIIWWTS